MKPIIFSLFDNSEIPQEIAAACEFELGNIVLRPFPDKETYVQIKSTVKDRTVVMFATLNNPNHKLAPLIFAAETARELGAKEIILIAPYLPYMRQDKQFNPGEGVTSKYFASLISKSFDKLITVDPHLHRRRSLDEIYTTPSTVLHASDAVARWINKQIEHPVLVGPDQESLQYVADVAQRIQAPFIVLKKIRKADRHVEISVPQIEQYKSCTAVLVDDIISTGHTMAETAKHLINLKMKPPVCVGIHGVFAEKGYETLMDAGVERVVTSNSIHHSSNAIDLSPMLAKALTKALLVK